MTSTAKQPMTQMVVFSSGDMSRTCSQFRKRVFDKCQLVPLGQVTTYGQLARILNTSPRAVGQALKFNGFKHVPCHRVVRSDLTLGGFHGQSRKDSEYVKRKEQMLRKENVKFDPSGSISRDCLCSDAVFKA